MSQEEDNEEAKEEEEGEDEEVLLNPSDLLKRRWMFLYEEGNVPLVGAKRQSITGPTQSRNTSPFHSSSTI